MKTRVDSMKERYKNFYGDLLPKIAISPFTGGSMVANSFFKPEKGGGGAAEYGAECASCIAVCFCCFPLLLLTFATGGVSGLLGIGAGLVSPITFGVAAAGDCCSPNVEEEPRRRIS